MLDYLNAISEIVAALGVLAGLIFVGVQIRNNTRAVRAQTFHAITDSFNAVNLAIGATEQTGRLARAGFGGMENLNEDERVQFSFIALAVMRVMETLFYQSSLGIAEKSLWRTEQKTIVALMSLPGMRQWWSTNQLSFSPEFRRTVDEIAAPAAGAPIQ